MRKVFIAILSFVTFLLVSTYAYAAPNLSIQIEQPQSPTNLNNIKINFVALDIANNPISVTCFKKTPDDAGFVQFGSVITLSAGGNTSNCEVTDAIINKDGTYQFYAHAIAGSETVDSSTVSVEYKTSGPGTPINFSKTKSGDCQYKITFKTADDSGRTSKVELYRSDQTKFDTNSGTRVGSLSIGSNQEGSFTNDISDCNKTYYYAIRAFDSAGNGSGVVGDSIDKITTIAGPAAQTQAASTGVGGAIAVSNNASQVVNPSSTESTTSGEVQGESTPSGEVQAAEDAQQEEEAAKVKANTGRIIGGILLLIVAGIVAYFAYRRFSK